MALRNQPYIPLYVQDFLTDEKLVECSAEATGVYIRLLCIMHKSDEYGTILLKQKYKQTSKQVENFACKLAKHMPYPEEVIHKGLHELIDEGVLSLENSKLFQKRMIRDNDISNKRSKAGSIGGKKTQFAKAKSEANSETETAIEIEVENKDEDVLGELKKISKYKHININRELQKMDTWLDQHPTRSKTKKFITSWLDKVEVELPREKKVTRVGGGVDSIGNSAQELLKKYKEEK